ncbi:uncharacterized protein FA14DRAFT_186260 [Meira miltonrushii]|uniref:Uncharacterized protein n=1 Tax=Meira miltonrushii TaxID=1280837 RepID=A0A316V445_9BASI|nr:uncharacterized protein FA14DRAFT_186260 [Meira miltonrushii]PWN31778.1 hypothetical protein FA14DRAFT_186260 [Meira miltonrushii]
MKITPSFLIIAFISSALVGVTVAAPHDPVVKRAATPVYVEFEEMAATFTEFSSEESDAAPPYNHLAYDLNVLSTTADSATQLLKQLGGTPLQPEDASLIRESVATIARKSASVQEMAIKGNDFYHANEAVGKICQILQLDAFQFYTLFNELKAYVTSDVFSLYGKDMSKTLCSFVDAIHTIEPNTFANNKSAYTYCVNYEAGLRGNLDTDGFDINSVAPPGIDSCGNSASRFLDAAYSEHTLGSIVTKCTAKNVGLFGPSLPENALDLQP